MKRSYIIMLAVLIVAAAGTALIVSQKKDNKSSSSSSSSSTDSMNMGSSNSNSSSSDSSSAVATNSVEINNFAFSPATITVKVGTKVTWTNKDSVGHNVVETDGADGPKSDTLAKGESYSFTYTKTGSFAYECSIHPSMQGKVVVTN